MESNPDLVDIINTYNEAMEKAKKGRQIPTADIYIWAVRNHLASMIHPGHKKHWMHRIGDYQQDIGPTARDAPTYEEKRRMMKQVEQ